MSTHQAVNFSEGIVERISKNPAKVLVARSLCCVNKGRFVVVRCLNTAGTPLEIRAGTPIAQFSEVDQVKTSELPVVKEVRLMMTGHHQSVGETQSEIDNSPQKVESLPTHLEGLFEGAT